MTSIKKEIEQNEIINDWIESLSEEDHELLKPTLDNIYIKHVKDPISSIYFEVKGLGRTVVVLEHASNEEIPKILDYMANLEKQRLENLQ